MYFESRSHESLPVANAREAAKRIHEGTLISHQVPIWKNANGQRIAAVPDGHIDNLYLEIVVINLDTREEIESITFGWINSLDLKAELLIAATTLNTVYNRDVQLNIDGAQLGGGPQKPVTFTCSCCGEWFKSTIAEQAKYDQDAGYGHCPKCAKYQ